MSGLRRKGIVLFSLVSGYFCGMRVVLERAFLPGLAPGSFPPHAWIFLFIFLLFPLFHPFCNSPGHGLPREPLCWGGAGYKVPGAGHAEFPAEKPWTCPGSASWHGLWRQAPGPPQLPDCCLGPILGLTPPASSFPQRNPQIKITFHRNWSLLSIPWEF